jgi:hypothetical protein
VHAGRRRQRLRVGARACPCPAWRWAPGPGLRVGDGCHRATDHHLVGHEEAEQLVPGRPGPGDAGRGIGVRVDGKRPAQVLWRHLAEQRRHWCRRRPPTGPRWRRGHAGWQPRCGASPSAASGPRRSPRGAPPDEYPLGFRRTPSLDLAKPYGSRRPCPPASQRERCPLAHRCRRSGGRRDAPSATHRGAERFCHRRSPGLASGGGTWALLISRFLFERFG